MPDPLSGSVAALSAKYGPTAAGIAIGTAAKYGLTLNEGARLTWRGVISDVLLLAFLGILALAITDWLKLTGTYAVLTAALSAVSSDRLARLVRDKFLKRVEDVGPRTDATGQLAATVAAAPGTAAIVPASTTAPASLTMIVSRADPRAAGVEQLGSGPLPKTGPEFTELLDRLDRPA